MMKNNLIILFAFMALIVSMSAMSAPTSPIENNHELNKRGSKAVDPWRNSLHRRSGVITSQSERLFLENRDANSEPCSVGKPCKRDLKKPILENRDDSEPCSVGKPCKRFVQKVKEMVKRSNEVDHNDESILKRSRNKSGPSLDDP